MNEVICEKCGAVMLPIDPNANCGMTCPKCGWGWATTPYNPLLEDNTTYTITLLPGNHCTKENIHVISEIICQNYLKAKAIIENAPAELFSGKADAIMEISQKLDLNAILFSIDPEFPY